MESHQADCCGNVVGKGRLASGRLRIEAPHRILAIPVARGIPNERKELRRVVTQFGDLQKRLLCSVRHEIGITRTVGQLATAFHRPAK